MRAPGTRPPWCGSTRGAGGSRRDICSETQGHPPASSAKHPGKAEPKRRSCPLQGAGGGGWLGALPAARIRRGQMEEVTDKGLSLEKKRER